MNILDEIVTAKKAYLIQRKKEVILESFYDSEFYNNDTYDLVQNLRRQNGGVISEFKRRSPSVQNINVRSKVQNVIPAYEQGGASGISVLTDTPYFKGEIDDLKKARSLTSLPILRKDFIIDTYQIHEAKSIGADVLLLIAYCLSKEEIVEFTELAHSLNLQIIFEIHDLTEMDKYYDQIDILGVNNRDLTTFEVDFNYAIGLYPELPKDKIKISESGIHSIEAYSTTIDAGYDGCLIGEYLMKNQNPESTLKHLYKSVN